MKYIAVVLVCFAVSAYGRTLHALFEEFDVLSKDYDTEETSVYATTSFTEPPTEEPTTEGDMATEDTTTLAVEVTSAEVHGFICTTESSKESEGTTTDALSEPDEQTTAPTPEESDDTTTDALWEPDEQTTTPTPEESYDTTTDALWEPDEQKTRLMDADGLF